MSTKSNSGVSRVLGCFDIHPSHHIGDDTLRTKSILTVIGILIFCSTAISFLGYHYLSLASEYRERNMIHLSETQTALDQLQANPVLYGEAVEAVRESLTIANAQAFWCINNLSSFEVNAVGWVGLSGALDICASNLETLAAAFAVLDEMEGPDALQRQGPDHVYAKGIALRDIVEASRAESRAFLPYTSVLSDLINTLTRYGTALLAVGIGLVYVVFARKLTEAESLQRHQN
ncbi:MAG: hypothetical protein AAF218_09630, partial [Pseudomonadota bacterium]